MPSISTSSEKLRRIRTITITPRHGDALDGLIDNDRPDDVGDDQDLEAKQDAPT